MYVKISSVATLPDYILLLGFETGEYKRFDMKPLIEKYEQFKPLTQVIGLFESFKIDVGGYGLIWNENIDISSDGIYENGIDCDKYGH